MMLDLNYGARPGGDGLWYGVEFINQPKGDGVDRWVATHRDYRGFASPHQAVAEFKSRIQRLRS